MDDYPLDMKAIYKTIKYLRKIIPHEDLSDADLRAFVIERACEFERKKDLNGGRWLH